MIQSLTLLSQSIPLFLFPSWFLASCSFYSPLLFFFFFLISFRAPSLAYVRVWFSYGIPRIFKIYFIVCKLSGTSSNATNFKYISFLWHFFWFIHFPSELCKDLFGKWAKLDDSCFSVETVSGGITNLREHSAFCCFLDFFFDCLVEVNGKFSLSFEKLKSELIY